MKKVAFALLVFHVALANAGSQAGRISGFVPYTNFVGREILIFKLENNPSSGCNASGRYAIDSSSPHFKATQAAIIAAFHAQTDVFVVFTESCNTWVNAWDVAYVCTGTINC